MCLRPPLHSRQVHPHIEHRSVETQEQADRNARSSADVTDVQHVDGRRSRARVNALSHRMAARTILRLGPAGPRSNLASGRKMTEPMMTSLDNRQNIPANPSAEPLLAPFEAAPARDGAVKG
jgi:hypothetical protein